MCNQTDFGTLIAIIGFIVLIDLGVAHGQIGGAVQYPPMSIGADAQPPPPARMVPELASPRRVEFGGGGSSLPPVNPSYPIYSNADPLPMQPVPLSSTGLEPPPTRTGHY
jgi:hypothetical protein